MDGQTDMLQWHSLRCAYASCGENLRHLRVSHTRSNGVMHAAFYMHSTSLLHSPFCILISAFQHFTDGQVLTARNSPSLCFYWSMNPLSSTTLGLPVQCNASSSVRYSTSNLTSLHSTVVDLMEGLYYLGTASAVQRFKFSRIFHEQFNWFA